MPYSLLGDAPATTTAGCCLHRPAEGPAAVVVKVLLTWWDWLLVCPVQTAGCLRF
jgi:hypothetical protein